MSAYVLTTLPAFYLTTYPSHIISQTLPPFFLFPITFLSLHLHNFLPTRHQPYWHNINLYPYTPSPPLTNIHTPSNILSHPIQSILSPFLSSLPVSRPRNLQEPRKLSGKLPADPSYRQSLVLRTSETLHIPSYHPIICSQWTAHNLSTSTCLGLLKSTIPTYV